MRLSLEPISINILVTLLYLIKIGRIRWAGWEKGALEKERKNLLKGKRVGVFQISHSNTKFEK